MDLVRGRFSGAIAASSVALAEYVGRFVPAAAAPRRFHGAASPSLPLVVSPKSIVALAPIALLSFIPFADSGRGASSESPRGLKASALVAIIALVHVRQRQQLGHRFRSRCSVSGMLLALVPIIHVLGMERGRVRREESVTPAACSACARSGHRRGDPDLRALNALYRTCCPPRSLDR